MLPNYYAYDEKTNIIYFRKLLLIRYKPNFAIKIRRSYNNCDVRMYEENFMRNVFLKYQKG